MEDYYAYHHRVIARKRRRRAVIAVLAVLALLCAAVGGYYFLAGEGKTLPDLLDATPVGAFFHSEPTPAPSASPTPVPSAAPTPAPTPEPAVAYTPQRLLPEADAAVWDTLAPVPAPETLDNGYYNTDFRMVAVPALGTVDDSYFDTATFVGDSIASGLGIYATGLPNAHYVAYTSALTTSFISNNTMSNAVTHITETPMETILASQPDYLYLHVGTNDIVNPADSAVNGYINNYEQLIGMLREMLPGVTIYIHSIPGVQEDVVETRKGLDNTRILTVNNMVANLALRTGCYFINSQEALSNTDGSMIDAYDAGYDGVHFDYTGYRAWADYLRTHTVWQRRSLYLGKNPYYIYGR